MLEALSLIHIKMASSSKKSKKSNNISKVDRISKLPDPLLVKIISLLPTKSAVQTSLLSKRWRPISLSLTNLDFDDSPRHKNCPIKFTNFVEKLLIHRPNDLNIEKFRLRCGRDYYFNRFDEWIGNAIGRDPREIRLSFWFRELYKVIPEIFLCTSLQVLKLSCGMLIDVPEDVRFSSLRVLKCERVRLSSCESVGRLLVNCPVLERLSIKMCKWLSGSRLSICGAALKKLTFSDTLADVDEVFLPDDDVIVPEVFIATPALETLYIGTFAADNILIEENLQFLRKAYFDLQQRVQGVLPSGVFGDCVFGLLKKINHVKSLSLHYRTVEVLNRAYRCDFKTVHNGFPPFHNLTELELSVEAYCEEILLCDFLYNSPNLQSLQFPQGLLDPLSGETWRFNWIWVRSKRVPECISTHLKTVYIREFHGTTDELSLVGYLLYNGSVLENVTIDTLVLQDDAEVDDAEDDDAEVDDAEVEVREELLQYPRKSTTCKLNLYF